MKLRFTPRAIRELDDILDYLADCSPSGAKRVQSRLHQTFDLLARYPEAGQQTTNKRLRRIVISPFPYLAFYEVVRDEVVVIGVRHAVRDPDTMPGR